MLSRVAETVYWMSRYLERAASMSRFIGVNFHLMLDLPEMRGGEWGPLVSVTGDVSRFKEHYGDASMSNVVRFLVFDTGYSNSIASCLSAARENARSVRDKLPLDLWEEVNAMHHHLIHGQSRADYLCQNPFEFLDALKVHSQRMAGVVHDLMSEGDTRHFYSLGRSLEQADKTSRLLDVKYFILLPSVDYVGTPYDDLQWAALLRSVGSLEIYRQLYGVMNAPHVIRFLVLDDRFPGSIQGCLRTADSDLHAITGTFSGSFSNEAEKRLGSLCGELSYMQVEDIVDKGIHEFVDGLQLKMNEVDNAVARVFFSPA